MPCSSPPSTATWWRSCPLLLWTTRYALHVPFVVPLVCHSAPVRNVIITIAAVTSPMPTHVLCLQVRTSATMVQGKDGMELLSTYLNRIYDEQETVTRRFSFRNKLVVLPVSLLNLDCH